MRVLALAVLLVVQGQPPEAAALHTAAGYMDKQQFEAAIELLEGLISAGDQDSPDAVLMLVDCYMRKGHTDAAYRAVHLGLQKHPDSAPLLKASGRLLLRDNRRSASAGEPLSKAVEVAPRDPETHYYYSQWACLHNREELCIQEAEQALALAPGNLLASLQLNALIGIAADQLNRPEQADAAFRKSLAANRKLQLPNPLSAYEYVAFLLRRARDEEAQAIVSVLLEKAPRFGPAQLERAKVLAKKGQSQQAIALAEKALELEGMDKEKLRAAHMLLARTYFLLGREEEASRHQVWIEQNPH